MGAACAAVEAHVRCWNGLERSGWLSLFSVDVTFDDPVGVPTKQGRAAAESSWDRSHRPGRTWMLHAERIVESTDGLECAVIMTNHGVVDGVPAIVNGIEIWRVNRDGRVVAVRAYFEQPTAVELDPYFRADPPRL